MEKGELPFLIEMPQKYENLKKLLDDHSAPDCEVIITRLIRLYHPSLREGNKLRLSRLFILLLRYVDVLHAMLGQAKCVVTFSRPTGSWRM